MWGGSIRFDNAHAVGDRLSCSCSPLGGVTGVVCANAGIDENHPQHLLHRRALPLCAVAWRGVLDLLRVLITGSAKMSGHPYPEFWAGWHFWMTFRRRQPWCSSRRHSSAWPACRGAIRTTPEAFAGPAKLRLLDRRLYQGGAAFLVFLYVCFRTFTSKEHVADNYWGEGRDDAGMDANSPPAFHSWLELPRIKVSELQPIVDRASVETRPTAPAGWFGHRPRLRRADWDSSLLEAAWS